MISRDLALTLALSVALAAWVTDHVALSVALMRRRPAWKGVASLVVVPLAPLFGFRARIFMRSALWIALAATYGVLHWRASR